MFIIEDEVKPVIHARQQSSTRAKHAKTLLPNGEYLLHIAVGNRMKDEIKAAIAKGKRLCHISMDDFYGVSLLLRKHALAFQLF